ncbi:FtsX-like permease family protein [Actinoplanes sp. GCM10030250]|uniref:ABC transporter permease n=1 Tax=Actinoplanes sp. GCM10030250 TaxID=3273376 RepID=UPI00361ABDC5
MRAVLKAAWAAARRRRVQSLVVFAVVLLASATSVLALGLLVASSAPFDRTFKNQNGAHASAAFDAAEVDAADLTATGSRPGVTGSAGPYEMIDGQLAKGGPRRPPGPIVGRADASTAVDRLEISDGKWLTGTGQIVLSRTTAGLTQNAWKVGDQVSVIGAGAQTLTVVGIASSATGSASAWVWPDQTDVLHASGFTTGLQMLYRFADAGTDAAVGASLDNATAGLPPGALTGSTTYLAIKLEAEGLIKVMVPFVVAFAVLGLVMSVLIVVNVVAGAVVAGFRTIGVQKALGFTPGQVISAYAGQVLLVGLPACLLGVVAGRLVAMPLLAQTESAYATNGKPSVPPWVDLAVLAGAVVLLTLAAAGPALRAGRLSAAQAIAVGRAPRSGRGFLIRRALAATALPRPVSFGLATPFTRPARAAVTVVAVLLGVATVVFATGLSVSLTRIADAGNRTAAVPVRVSAGGPMTGGVGPAGQQAGPPPNAQAAPGTADPAAVRKIIEAQPGTAHVAAETSMDVSVAGSTEPVEVRAYDGVADWTGYPMLSGRWYQNAGEAVAGARMLKQTGTQVGDTVTISTEEGRQSVRIVGEAFSNGSDAVMLVDFGALKNLAGEVKARNFEIGLSEGTDPYAYVDGLTSALGGAGLAAAASVSADTQENELITVMMGMIASLTLLLTGVAGLGVLNTVVLNTRERTHEIGVLKAVGMTPGQVRLMVISSMVVIGVVGGALAVPLGWVLHQWAVPVMAGAAGLTLPEGILAVFSPVRLMGLGTAGVVLAVAGALVPAGWAARTRAAAALRAE